jgi:hypothetical protein
MNASAVRWTFLLFGLLFLIAITGVRAQVVGTVAAICPDTAASMFTGGIGGPAVQFGLRDIAFRDSTGHLVPIVRPQWSTKPATLGRVDSTGKYLAGRPGIAVVQVRYGPSLALWCVRNTLPGRPR